MSSDQSVHTGASTPLPSGGSVACKVTPLADAGLPDLNARYPYGTDDHTDVNLTAAMVISPGAGK